MNHPAPTTLRLGDIASRIWSHRWLVTWCFVAGLVLASAASFVLPRTYTSTAEVQVSPITTTPFSSTPASQQVSIETERNIMNSPDLAQSVVDDLGLGIDARTLLQDVTVSSPQGSLVLRVSYTDPDPQRASDVANAFAEEYLEARTSRAEEISSALRANLDEQIAELSQSSNESSFVQEQILELQQEQQRLIAVGVDTGNVFGVAAPAESPSSLSPMILLVGGGAVGLLGGAFAALAFEVIDPRARRSSRITSMTGWDVVSAEGVRDDEAMVTLATWLTSHLESADLHRRAAVVTIVPTGGRTPLITDALADYLARAGLDTTSLSLGPDDHDAIDRGYPADVDRETETGILLFDARRVPSVARQVALASRSDAVLVLAQSRTRLANLRPWMDAHRDTGVPLCTWFQTTVRRDESDVTDVRARVILTRADA